MKKLTKLTALVLALTFVLAMAVPAFAATVSGTVKLSSGYMNVRKSASTKASVIGKLYNGDKVTIYATSGDWYKIKSDEFSGYGYIMQKYVTRGSSSSSSSSTSSGTASVGDTVTANRATKIYKKASTTKGTVCSISKGASMTVLSGSTTSYYKVSYNGETGYIPKKYVNVSSSGGSSSSSSTGTTSGNSLGIYTSTEITAPAAVCNTRFALFNAINYNLTQFNTNFTVTVGSGYTQSWLPTTMSMLEHAFTTGSITPSFSTSGSNKVIRFTVNYDEGGKVMAALTQGKTSMVNDTASKTLLNKVNSIISSLNLSRMSDYDKVVAVHDYIVSNVQYGTRYSDYASAYGALVTGYANCMGYAEANALLLSAAGVENRFVWAKSKMTSTGTHAFNKVKVNGKWYAVDCTVDDPEGTDPSYTKRDFLLVSDSEMRQRYQWDEDRYPAATDSKSNWHYENDLVATSQSQFESIVKREYNKGERLISVFVPSYSSSKFSFSFLKNYKGYNSAKKLATPPNLSTYSTAIYIDFTN